MQPLRIILPGDYWDTQIYQGRLYIFGFDGSITTYDWDRLIEEWPVRRELALALTTAFLRSDYLYGADLVQLFADPEVREVVESKFERLGRSPCALRNGGSPSASSEHRRTHSRFRMRTLRSTCETFGSPQTRGCTGPTPTSGRATPSERDQRSCGMPMSSELLRSTEAWQWREEMTGSTNSRCRHRWGTRRSWNHHIC